MAQRVVPFSAEHVQDAADLVASTYERFRALEPLLPHHWVDLKALQPSVAAAHEFGPGVAAIEGERLQGFLIAELDLGGPMPEVGWPSDASLGGIRSADISIACHGATGAERAEVYREMYAALAELVVEAGCFRHSIALPVCDREGVEAWFGLGFGVDQVLGVRDVGPAPTRREPGLSVRRATEADIEALLSLSVDILAFHAASPIFRPYYFAAGPVARDFERALGDNERAIFVAERDGRLLGMMEVGGIGRPSFNNARDKRDFTIGMASVAAGARFEGVGSAILGAVLAWAQEMDLERCTVGWTSANLASSRFWRGHGFRPLHYTLTRQLDERIISARPPKTP